MARHARDRPERPEPELRLEARERYELPARLGGRRTAVYGLEGARTLRLGLRGERDYDLLLSLHARALEPRRSERVDVGRARRRVERGSAGRGLVGPLPAS